MKKSLAVLAVFIISGHAYGYGLFSHAITYAGTGFAVHEAERAYDSGRGSETASQQTEPNPSLTPGAIDSRVTQDNIDQTICVRGYTKTVRPPESYTRKLKEQGIRDYGYADTRFSSYEEDHLVSLEIGGSPDDPRNLWPEPHYAAGGWGSYVKDRLENKLHELVCERRLGLAEAQYEEAHDWISAYKKYVGPYPEASR